MPRQEATHELGGLRSLGRWKAPPPSLGQRPLLKRSKQTQRLVRNRKQRLVGCTTLWTHQAAVDGVDEDASMLRQRSVTAGALLQLRLVARIVQQPELEGAQEGRGCRTLPQQLEGLYQ